MADIARGELAQGCARLRESHALDPAVGTVFNLADCEERSGRTGTAWALFIEARDRLEPSDPRHAEVQARIQAIEPRLARLTLRLADGTPAGVALERDGLPVGSGSVGVPVVVDPGTHVVVLEAPGHEPSRHEVEVATGELREITVAVGRPLPPEARPTPAPTPPPAAQGSSTPATQGSSTPASAPLEQDMSLHPFGVPLLVLGLAAAGVGIGLGAAAQGDYEEVSADCPGNLCNQQGYDVRQDAVAQADVATGVFFGGVALGAVGLILEIVELASADAPGPGGDPIAVRFGASGARGRWTGGIGGRF
jgi:hypothetical protein